MSDTKQRILDIARELFARQGYTGTSIADIARELGTTTAALYYHFPSKADILGALLAEPLAAFTRIIEDLDKAQPSPAELLEAFIDLTVESRELASVIDRDPTVLSMINERLPRKSHELTDQVITALAGPKADRAATIRANAAFATIKGATMAALAQGDGSLTPEDRAEILSAALRALGPSLARPSGKRLLAHRAETERIPHRCAALIVVEVHIGVAAAREYRPDPLSPGPQRLAPVHRARAGRALMAPQVDEPGGAPQRRHWPAEPVSPAQRGAAGLQHLADLGRPPGRMPELSRHLHPGRETAQTAIEQHRVGPKGRRELQQYWPELVAQPASRVEQPGDRFLRLGQPLDVGEVAACLHRHHERRRRRITPRLERTAGRQPVEGRIGFHRVEPLGVGGQPAPLWQARRIQHATPVGVLPSRCSDPQRHREPISRPSVARTSPRACAR
jgi:AcrR family transcriptional regulator